MMRSGDKICQGVFPCLTIICCHKCISNLYLLIIIIFIIINIIIINHKNNDHINSSSNQQQKPKHPIPISQFHSLPTFTLLTLQILKQLQMNSIYILLMFHSISTTATLHLVLLLFFVFTYTSYKDDSHNIHIYAHYFKQRK